MFKSLSLLMGLLVCCVVSKAAVGCRIGNLIYTNQHSGSSATVVIAVVTYGNFQNNQTLSANAPACPRAGNITPVTAIINLCVINGSIGSGIGNMVNYDRLDPPIGCPIDDHAIWLLFASSMAVYAGNSRSVRT